jgi:hypothetical protein
VLVFKFRIPAAAPRVRRAVARSNLNVHWGPFGDRCAANCHSTKRAKIVPKMASPPSRVVSRPTTCERNTDRKSRAIGELSNLQTPLMRNAAISRIVDDETLKDELKRKLAFEEVGG